MADVHALNLSDAIRFLREELIVARQEAIGRDIILPIEKATIELQLVLEKAGEGKAGFKVPIVDVELGVSGKYGQEATHKITLELGQPTDRQLNPIRVDRTSVKPLD